MANPLSIEFEFRDKRYKDAQKGLEAFARRFEGRLERAGPVLSRELRSFLETVATALARRHGNPWPGGTTDSTLSRRSGQGIQSIWDSIKVTGTRLDDVTGQIGANGRMKIHETGGIIQARRAKYLTIPLPPALNSDGTPKKQRARDWDKTFVIRSKKGNLLIVRRAGKELVPLYVLKTQVKIPPRLGLRKTLETGLPYFVDKAMATLLQELRRP